GPSPRGYPPRPPRNPSPRRPPRWPTRIGARAASSGPRIAACSLAGLRPSWQAAPMTVIDRVATASLLSLVVACGSGGPAAPPAAPPKRPPLVAAVRDIGAVGRPASVFARDGGATGLVGGRIL